MGTAAAETAPIDTPGTPPSERERLASVVPIRREDRRTEASPAGGAPGEAVPQQDVIDDPDAISDDDEDIETSGEIGQAVVERLLGGTVISEDDEEG